MNNTKVPTSGSNLNNTLNSLWATKDQANWTIAAIVHTWTTTETLELDREALVKFRQAPGFKGNTPKIRAYREAYEVAISEGLVKPLKKGDNITIPTVSFSNYVEGTQWKIKARTQKQSKAKSRQQENLERDGHTPGTPKPSNTHKQNHSSGPRVATPAENIERALQEVEVALKKIGGGLQRQQIEFAKLQLQSALMTFAKATN